MSQLRWRGVNESEITMASVQTFKRSPLTCTHRRPACKSRGFVIRISFCCRMCCFIFAASNNGWFIGSGRCTFTVQYTRGCDEVWCHWHRRRSDWNSGGTHGGTYYKSPAVEAKNTFPYIVMQVIWCLKFCNMTKSGGQSPRSKFWGTCSPVSPVIYAHGHWILKFSLNVDPKNFSGATS